MNQADNESIPEILFNDYIYVLYCLYVGKIEFLTF